MAVAASVICLGLLYLSHYDLPTWTIPLDAFGRHQPLSVPGKSVMTALMVAITCLGIHATLPADPLRSRHSVLVAVSYWALPVLVTVGAITLIPDIGRWSLRITAIALVGGGLTLLAYLQVISREGKPATRRIARLVLDILAWGAFWIASANVLADSGNIWLRTFMVEAISWGLALCFLRDTGARLRRIWLYATIIAIGTSELMIGLVSMRTHPQLMALSLLVCFYCLIGICRLTLQDRLDRRATIEYVIVAAVGLVLPWLHSI